MFAAPALWWGFVPAGFDLCYRCRFPASTQPLAAITAVFVYTLGARKLTEREGRLLKLVSGLMMLGLGTLLLVAPQLLSNPLVAVLLLAAAIVVTVIAAQWLRGDRAG